MAAVRVVVIGSSGDCEKRSGGEKNRFEEVEGGK